jgi:hypothetical protein
VRRETRERRRSQRFRPDLGFELSEQLARDCRNVASPLAQWRNGNDEALEAMKQISAEGTGGNALLERRMGGRHYPHIRAPPGAGSAHSPNLIPVERAEELRLRVQR